MAYKNNNMSVIAYANGFTFWHYRTEDSIELIEENRYYFTQQIVKLMAVGDVIYITSKGITYQRQVVDIVNNVATIGTIN